MDKTNNKENQPDLNEKPDKESAKLKAKMIALSAEKTALGVEKEEMKKKYKEEKLAWEEEKAVLARENKTLLERSRDLQRTNKGKPAKLLSRKLMLNIEIQHEQDS